MVVYRVIQSLEELELIRESRQVVVQIHLGQITCIYILKSVSKKKNKKNKKFSQYIAFCI